MTIKLYIIKIKRYTMKCVFLFILFFQTVQLNSQSVLFLKEEAKMRHSDNAASDVYFRIPAGTKIQTISLKNGYYKVEYNGKIGYINEMYFGKSSVGNTIPQSSQGYSGSNKTSSSVDCEKITLLNLQSPL